jgi:hypothetical protein
VNKGLELKIEGGQSWKDRQDKLVTIAASTATYFC